MSIMQLKTVLILLLSVTQQLHAQQSVLLKITPPESDKASYIFAAYNNAHVAEYNFAPIFNIALQQVNAVAFEWLPENYELENMLSVMKNTGDETLRKYYKRDDNIRYELVIINKLQEDVEKYWDLQPLYIMQVMRNYDCGVGLHYQQQLLQQAAIDQIKPIISLWNLQIIRDQMQQVDFDKQAAILSDYVNKEAEFETSDEEKWRFYEKQNLEGFAITMQTIETADYINQVINKQATDLSNKISVISPQQATLYFIDSKYLGGVNGVLQSLRNMNYTIEDVPVALMKMHNDSSDESMGAISTDMFPEIILDIDTANKLEGKTIVIRKEDIVNQYSAKYKAEEDPFGDMLDFLAQDTSFKWLV